MKILATIIINNYNYGRFLKDAVGSALNQTYRHTEVIVVDDGSTDNSREIIARYGDRIIPVLQENRGQASAFNAGFALSRGDVILFLDADDWLCPTAVEQAVNLFAEPGVAKVHWPLWIVDEHGRRTEKLIPGPYLPEGDLLEVVRRDGPWGYVTPPTSGNAWARRFLEQVIPVPEDAYKLCADAYLFALAPLFGRVKRVSEPQGFYRLHGQNRYRGQAFDEKLSGELWVYDQQCLALSKFFSDMGVEADPDKWKRNSWPHRLHQAIQEISAFVPPGDAFILVDGDLWGAPEVLAGRRRIPFLERDGQYWGPPADDDTAICELERLRRSGASFIVFAWPAFWWLDHYAGLHRHLRSAYRCALENDRLVVFDLRS
ncbi:MAG: glycosyltransferase [Chloroflexi bacterium]|nr:glycosyltransferase [Chloroflexota bacterium]